MERIAIIVGKMNSGGKKNLIMEYYRHIDRDKIQFDFICDSDSQAIPREEILKLGGSIYEIAPYQNIFKNMRDMKKIFDNNNYKVVHAYNNTMNFFSMFVAKWSKIPVRISESISMAHKSDWKTIIKTFLKPLAKFGANYYLACGEECGRWQFGNKLFDEGKVNVFKTVINAEYNSFNQQERERVRKEYNWEDKIVVGHIARFTVQKNSLQMIDIFNAIAKKENNAVLCLIGDGELKDEMLEKIKKLGIESKVYYLGMREDVQQFYNAMDCFILPSLYEGLPVVGLEAECCGLPMFFSKNIAEEANACELGHFISLEETPEFWADKVLEAVQKNMHIRKNHINEIKKQGFDSIEEAKRLQQFYFDAIKKEIK